MKYAFVSIAVCLLLSACANLGNPAISTPAPNYTAYFIGAQPPQDVVNLCVKIAEPVFWDENIGSALGAINGLHSACAYEGCMREAGYAPRGRFSSDPAYCYVDYRKHKCYQRYDGVVAPSGPVADTTRHPEWTSNPSIQCVTWVETK